MALIILLEQIKPASFLNVNSYNVDEKRRYICFSIFCIEFTHGNKAQRRSTYITLLCLCRRALLMWHIIDPYVHKLQERKIDLINV